MGFEQLISFFEAHSLAAYVVLFLCMVIEGEALLILAGVLAQMGALSFPLVLTVALSGVLVGDVLWYGLGILLRHDNLPKSVVSILRLAERVVARFYPQFAERPAPALIFGKFIYGTNHATLVLSGYKKIRFLLFAKIETFASVLWVLVFAFLGYFMGYAALQFTHRISLALLLVLVFIVSFISLQRFISFYFSERGVGSVDDQVDAPRLSVVETTPELYYESKSDRV